LNGCSRRSAAGAHFGTQITPPVAAAIDDRVRARYRHLLGKEFKQLHRSHWGSLSFRDCAAFDQEASRLIRLVFEGASLR
jgi:hypothetical protein